MAMMGTKFSTKTWSDSPQNELRKKESTQNLSATELQQLNGENIGDILNKVVDPNYIDPKKKMRTVGSDKLDKDAFMKLMLAQMKNQDPTNPMKSHEMAAQLAQFTSVEQLTNMNTTLSDIKNGQKPSESFQALNFIGKSVAGDSAKVTRLKGDKDHDFTFSLPDDATDVKVSVRNALGEDVRKVELKNLKKGENFWRWNGTNDNGNEMPVGEYQMLIEAKASNGKKLAVKTDFDGLITGVSYTAEGPVLLVGNQSIKMKDVRKIVDPSLKNNDQKLAAAQKPDLKNQPPASDNERKGAQEVIPQPANLMDAVGMSQGLMNKIGNETKPDSVKE